MTLVRSRNGGNLRRSVIITSTGLLNNPGDNNCFMNSAIQVFWHLDVFRRSFRLLRGHACLEDCCIFCALKEIFGKFQDSDDVAHPPDVLRIAMAKAFQDQRKFQIGKMGDAAECFENILRRLHDHITFGGSEDICTAKYCIPHQKFSMQMLEQTFCECGATSEPFNFFETVTYVAASALIEEARYPQRNGYSSYTSFATLLKATLSHGGSRQCPDEGKCMYIDKETPPTKMHRTLLNCPDIVCIGINWDTDRPSTEYVMDVMDCLGRRLEVRDLYDSLSDDRAKKMKLRLFGIMTYYGKHYTTFFYNTRRDTWYYFDDARVKEVGNDWNTVKERCIRGRYQPLLAFYVNPEGEAIKADKAPRKTEIMSKEELLASRNNNEMANQRRKENLAKKASKRKGKKHSEEEQTRNPPAKRKSFKNFVSSALKKDRSRKSLGDESSSSKNQEKYSGGHVLSVNGHDTSMGVIGPYFEINGYVAENGYIEEDNKKNRAPVKEGTKAQTTPTQEEESVFRYESSPPRMNGRSPESHRLQKHQAHLKSLETSLDAGDSDEDILDNKKAKSRHQRTKSQQLPVRDVSNERAGTSQVVKDTVEDGRRRSSGKTHEQEIGKQSQAQRRYIDNGDAYADGIGEADFLVVRSISAEQEGNLFESYRLCNDAKALFRHAMDLDGITDKMRGHADKKRWETNNRLRLLGEKISELRARGSKSADYDRQISKTSDYGSLSDASGSPLGQSQNGGPPYQKFLKDIPTSNQDYPVVEKGGIQAKLNKERNKVETAKKQKDPTKSIFFTLPRKKKSSQGSKSSAQEPPTQSEIDQLSVLLTNLNTYDLDDNRSGSLDFDKNRIQHRSEPYLPLPSGSPNRSMSEPNRNMKTAVVKSADAFYLDKSKPSTIGAANKSVEEIRNGPSRSATFSVPEFRHEPQANGDIVAKQKTVHTDYIIDGNGAGVKVNPKNKSLSTSSVDAGYQTMRKSPHNDQKLRSESQLSGRSLGPETAMPDPRKVPEIGNRGDSIAPSALPERAENSETGEKGKKEETTEKSVERKKSFLKVIVPKIMSIERVRSVKKAKKATGAREEEYRAMLKAQTQENGPGSLSQGSLSQGSLSQGSLSQGKGDAGKKPKPSLDINPHERSIDSLGPSEDARKEVDAVTKAVTEERLFEHVGRRFSRDKSIDSGSWQEGKGKEIRSDGQMNGEGHHKQTAVEPITYQSPSTTQPRRFTQKFAIGEKGPEAMTSTSYYMRNAVSQSSIVQKDERKRDDYEGDYSEGPASEGKDPAKGRRIQQAVEYFSKSQPEICDQSSEGSRSPLEPPPRKNPNVYRSSELYKKASPVRTATQLRDQQSPPVEPEARRGNASRWGGQVDFANSARRMCQQCGTVTVEKPRKFCRQCQSDYL